MGVRLYIHADDDTIEKILGVSAGSIQEYRRFEAEAENFKKHGAQSEFANLFPADPDGLDNSVEYRIWLAEDRDPTLKTLGHFFTYGFGRLNDSQVRYIESNNLGDRNSGQATKREHISSLICLHDTHINMGADTWNEIDSAYWG